MWGEGVGTVCPLSATECAWGELVRQECGSGVECDGQH